MGLAGDGANSFLRDEFERERESGEVLRLRVSAPEGLEQKLVSELGGIKGVHRVTDETDLLSGGKVLNADLAPSAADAVMDRLNGLGVDPEDYVIVREELVAPRMGPGSAVEPEDGFASRIERGADRAQFSSGKVIPIRETTARVEGLSGHAYQEDLVEWFRRFGRRPSRVVLNHGTEPARAALAAKLRDELSLECALPARGEPLAV